MRAQLYTFLIGLSAFFSASYLLADITPDKRISLEAYQQARDHYLTTLVSSVDRNDLVKTLAKMKNGAYAVNLPALLPEGSIKEGKEQALHEATSELERASANYHDIKEHRNPLMALILKHEEDPISSTLIYYSTRDLKTAEKIYHGILCDQSSCHFNIYTKDDIKKLCDTTRIKLILKHKTSANDKTATLSDNAVELAGLSLDDTKEWSGEEDIAVALHFFDGDKFLQEQSVFLPWATKGGFNANTGHLPFFTWPKQSTKAIAVIYKNDSDSTFVDIAKEIAKAVKIFGPIGEAISKIAGKVIDKFEQWFVQDHYIGTAIFERDDLSDQIITEENNTTFYLNLKH